jgi:hypothetical protein
MFYLQRSYFERDAAAEEKQQCCVYPYLYRKQLNSLRIASNVYLPDDGFHKLKHVAGHHRDQ